MFCNRSFRSGNRQQFICSRISPPICWWYICPHEVATHILCAYVRVEHSRCYSISGVCAYVYLCPADGQPHIGWVVCVCKYNSTISKILESIGNLLDLDCVEPRPVNEYFHSRTDEDKQYVDEDKH